MKKLIMFALLTFIYTLSFAFDNDLTSISIRPGTDEMFVAGEFKTIFVVNKNTGAEIRRLTVEKRVKDLQFSKDGKNLLMFDGSKVVFLNPESGEAGYSVKGNKLTLFENSPYFVNADFNYSGSVVVYSTEDGSEVFKHTPSFKSMKVGFDAEFKELIIVGSGMDIKGEKNLVTRKVEEAESYNVYNKAYIEQQKDKQGSGFEVIDMESKLSKINSIIPYKPGTSFGLSISKYQDNYYISSWDMLLKIDKAGMATPISCTEATFAYATNATQNSKKIVVTSTKKGFVYNCENGQYVAFDARDENEFAYSMDVTFDAEFTYILNKDFTVSVLNDKAMKVKSLKIDNSTGKGFGVYYYNGFNKKEDRDKEANIINEQLKVLSLPTIDLEANIGARELLIGTFDTIEKAEEFKKAIKSKGLNYITTIAPIE
ncbi:MAG: hypothetical protein ABJG68_03205 [Crocinitomicaceae bacterium]